MGEFVGEFFFKGVSCFCSGLEGGESVFEMIKFAEVAISDESKFALIRGLIIKGDFEGFKTALADYSIVIDEETFLVALEDLTLNDRHLWLPEVCAKKKNNQNKIYNN